MERADFVTIHLAKTTETVGLIDADLLAKAKPGIRIINVARGGIVDEEALADAIRSGDIGGAALDVFAEEPTTESPLFELDAGRGHPAPRGVAPREAQDKAGDTIAEQVLLALAGDFVPFAVNVSAAEASETVRPFLPLAERLGRALRRAGRRRAADARDRVPGPARRLRHPHPHAVGAQGRVRRACRTEPVSYVNAPQIAEESGRRGVVDRRRPPAHEYVNLVTVRGGDHAIAGTLVGLEGRAPHRR